MIYRWAPFPIAAAVFLLDRISKMIIKSHLSAYDTIRIIPGFFNIVHSENPGVAFGLFADCSSPYRSILLIGLSVVVLVLITTVLLRSSHHPGVRNWLMRIALAFILGGALGNLYDRIVHGTVTDFVEIYADTHYFPAFNVADSAITVGAVLLVIDMLRNRNKQPHMADASH